MLLCHCIIKCKSLGGIKIHYVWVHFNILLVFLVGVQKCMDSLHCRIAGGCSNFSSSSCIRLGVATLLDDKLITY